MTVWVVVHCIAEEDRCCAALWALWRAAGVTGSGVAAGPPGHVGYGEVRLAAMGTHLGLLAPVCGLTGLAASGLDGWLASRPQVGHRYTRGMSCCASARVKETEGEGRSLFIKLPPLTHQSAADPAIL